MSREVKRVPMNFDWPIGHIWKGYLNPYHPAECSLCGGSGMNAATTKLGDEFYDHSGNGSARWCDKITQDEVAALIECGRLWDLTRKWDGDKWIDTGKIPTPDQVNAWNKRGIGHDSINRMILVETRAKRLGIWGTCHLCNGAGHLWPEDRYETLWNDWEPIQPPIGDGYQLWENVTEGSPISPVFTSLEEVAEWAAENVTTFGAYRASKEEWFDMLKAGFVSHKEGNISFKIGF